MTEEAFDFYNFSPEDLAIFLEERFSLRPFRAKQMMQWVYQKGITDIAQMTNLNKSLREEMRGVFSFPETPILKKEISKDGTQKFLFGVGSGDQIESVLIQQTDRRTLCVSSQVGCALGCTFCQTGTMKLKRNLTTSEIVRQFVITQQSATAEENPYSNVVLMGMGEALHNYKNVVNALKIITDDHGLALSNQKITLSTAGLVPALKKFSKENVPVNIAISLNATTDGVRSQIMPINNSFPLEVLLKTLRDYPLKKRQRFTIEYVMLGGINDSDEDLKRLPELLTGIKSKINLIPYNDNAGLGFNTPSKNKIYRWQQALMDAGFVTTIRWSKGQDINAACGQLVTASRKTAA